VLTAITRQVNPRLVACELTFQERVAIDAAEAAEQHAAYENCLRCLGLRVISLPPLPDQPDGVFVEDPALVLDELAIVTRMGAESRRGESASLAEALTPFRPLTRLEEPATLEGGDVMRMGRTLYVGLSRRTNEEGVRQLTRIAAPLGYRVVPVRVTGCLHLKTACCAVNADTVMMNRTAIDARAFRECHILDVPPEEPWAADVLAIGTTVLIPASFPHTARLLAASGFAVQPIDVSELQKAEAGVTCMSLIFDGTRPGQTVGLT
jgi:dimethylargininase